MSYEEFCATRAERAAAAAKRRAEWLANVDPLELEQTQREADEFAALSDDY